MDLGYNTVGLNLYVSVGNLYPKCLAPRLYPGEECVKCPWGIAGVCVPQDTRGKHARGQGARSGSCGEVTGMAGGEREGEGRGVDRVEKR